MKIKRIVCFIMALSLLVVSFSGCGNQDKKNVSNKLTWWMPLSSNAATRFSNFGETELAKQLMDRLDVEIEFIHPPQGQEKEKFNIMVSSDELPDIITYNWMKYPGGPAKAIKEDVIIDISKYKDSAKNLFGHLDKNEDIRKLATTDNGEVFSFPLIRLDQTLNFSSGIIVRGDWLEELNLEMPSTIDEWEKVLTEFKDKKGATAPFSSNDTTIFASAFDTTTGYYLKDGKVTYGVLEESYKDYLTAMNRWYSKGLIDPSYATLDSKTIQSNILNNVSGATVGSIGSGIGNWMNAGKIENLDYSLEGAPIPVPAKGVKAKFGNYQHSIPSSTNTFIAISSSCKNVEKAIEVLDYGYSDEGHMLYNFGIEGESYEMIDGYPTYTEEITANPEGLSMTASLAKYALSYAGGPFIQDRRYMEQYAQLPQQKRAWETWSNTDIADIFLPHLFVKQEELTEYAQLDNDINTYVSEMVSKIIIGDIPVDDYDSVIEGLKRKGIDRMLEIKQAAYDRYLER